MESIRRVVVIGASGFVGSAICARFEKENINVLKIGQKEINLLKENSHDQLASLINIEDCVVAVSALAPAKTILDVQKNITIVSNMIRAIEIAKPSYVLNIGSDAVFDDLPLPISEASGKNPYTPHGIMHLARELCFGTLDTKVGTLRPTLIYGKDDPHNGYGPNRFLRLALKSEPINLFGNGEEQRDHVFIDDVSILASLMVKSRLVGSLNAATGKAMSFMEVASTIKLISESSSEIVSNKRNGPMPHNGIRTFDPSKIYDTFPSFSFTAFEEAISKIIHS